MAEKWLSDFSDQIPPGTARSRCGFVQPASRWIHYDNPYPTVEVQDKPVNLVWDDVDDEDDHLCYTLVKVVSRRER